MESCNTRRRQVAVAIGVGLLTLSACGHVRPGRPDPLRSDVDQFIMELEAGLRSGGWHAVERLFSEDYRGFRPDVERGIDDLRQRRFMTDWQLRVDRVLTQQQDRLINVSVHWWQRWNDQKGQPHKSEGQSQLILRREGMHLRILDIVGARMF